MLGPCGPRYRTFAGTAGLVARSCGPLKVLVYGTRLGESLCSVPVAPVVVHSKARRASALGPVVLSDTAVLPEARQVIMLGPCGQARCARSIMSVRTVRTQPSRKLFTLSAGARAQVGFRLCDRRDEVAAYMYVSELSHLAAGAYPHDRGVPVLFQTRGHNFGLTSAVKSYNRKPAFQVAARHFLACPVSPFSTILPSLSPASRAGARARSQGHQVNSFRGPRRPAFGLYLRKRHHLSPRKSVPWEQVFTPSVGIVNDFKTTHIDGTVATRVKPPSRDTLLALLKRAVVESIASKLRWVTIGPVFRAATQPLRARRYDGGLTDDAGRFLISSSSPLMASVRFVIGLLEAESIPDVVFRLRDFSRPKVTVRSDASWSPDPLLKFGSGRVAFIAKLVWPDSRERVCLRSLLSPPRSLAGFMLCGSSVHSLRRWRRSR